MVSIWLSMESGRPFFLENCHGFIKKGHILLLEDGTTVDDFFITRRGFRFILYKRKKQWAVKLECPDVTNGESDQLGVIVCKINNAIQADQAVELAYPELSSATQHYCFQALVIPD